MFTYMLIASFMTLVTCCFSSVYPPYPTPNMPGTIYLINTYERPSEDIMLIMSIQGSLSKTFLDAKPYTAQLIYQVNDELSKSADYIFWNDLTKLYGQSVVFDSDSLFNASIISIVNHFSQWLDGVYVVEASTDSVNIGYSLCGITDRAFIATTKQLQSIIKVPIIRNLTGHTESQFVSDALKAKQWPFSTRFLASQSSSKAMVALSDWTIVLGAIQIYQNASFEAIIAHMHEQSRSVSDVAHDFMVSFGWVPNNSGEHDYTGAMSAIGGGVLASDWLYNAATHVYFTSQFPVMKNPTKSNPKQLPDNKNKHTVAFLFSDGDNICSDMNLINDGNHFNHPRRGEQPIGWGLNPTLAWVAPAGLNAYYTRAADNDSFIPFSSTYAYPDYMSPEAVGQWSDISAEAMQRADMTVLNFIGNNFSLPYYAPLLSQWSIEGAFYWPYYNNYVNDPPGEVQWYNDKPIVATRASLWADHANSTQIAELVNQQKRDHTTTDGYSLIAVHIWSETIVDVLNAIEGLDQDVLVVKPDALIQLMTKHVNPSTRKNIKLASE